MTELVKYEAACRALAEAVAVDEVMTIRDQSEALRLAARVAKNVDLEVQAAQLRFRAERRLGELVKAQKETVGLNRGGRPRAETRSSEEQVSPPTLAEAGIDRKLSSKAQKLAAMDAEAFEAALARHEGDMRAGAGRIVMDLNKVAAEEKGREHRRNLAQALSDTTALTPTGRRYPCAYIDLPWRRNGGIGNRAYENHYPTMPWPEILAFLHSMRDALLPDSWAFFWIPRAHLLALVEIEIEVTMSATGEVGNAKVMMPLGWAVAHALGMDSYSTCFVWTKTDEEHPDDSGSGLIAWDQDELLLLFKRGRGLPKPESSEKFGSNHRERAREHSRKPEHYRQMIAAMVGKDKDGQPLSVLEMFARVDAEHPLPPNWHALGNQAGEASVSAPAEISTATDMSDSLPAARPGWFTREELIEAERSVLEEVKKHHANAVDSPVWADLKPGDTAPDGGVVISDYEAAIVRQCMRDGYVVLNSEIANGSDVTRAAASPALSAGVVPAEHGEVVSDAAAPAVRADAAVSPANRPGANSDDDGLDIPAFLRRAPIAQTEMDLARIDRAPAVVVDDCLQTRLPLTDDEVELQSGLRGIDAGEEVQWTIVRQLIGAGYAHAGTDRVTVTDAGRAWLAQLVSPAAAAVSSIAVLTDDEIALRDCLSTLNAGGDVDPRVMRQAVSDGLVKVSRGKGVLVTDEGHAWLAQRCAVPQVGGVSL